MENNNNLEIVQLDDGKFGFQDLATGRVLDEKFDEIVSTKEGCAIVKLNGKFAVYNPARGGMPQQWFDQVAFDSDGWASVKVNGKTGFYNLASGRLSQQLFDEADPICEGWARVKNNGKYTYYCPESGALCAREFDGGEAVLNGWAVVANNGGSTYFKPETDTLCGKTFAAAVSVDEQGFGAIRRSKGSNNWSYFNPDEEYVFQDQWQPAFVPGLDKRVAAVGAHPEEFEHFPSRSFRDKKFIRACLDSISQGLEETCKDPSKEAEALRMYKRVSNKLAEEKKVSMPISQIPKAIRDLGKEVGED